MKKTNTNKPYQRIALALSLFLLIIWCILGTGASLAWFTDTSTEINNIFHFADFNVVVSHRLTDGTWEEVDDQTKIFDDEALYEPGYVQVVYLKVENKSKLPLNFLTAVNVNGCDVATNAFGMQFMLHDYLKFGLTLSDTEAEMKNSIANRSMAEKIADMPLHNYYHDKYETDSARLEPNATKYIALIVRMPKEVDNFANYRNDRIPKVELGITVKAEQVPK